ncbi:AAA family ATPase [Janibacter terrae]|uniref:AAA family ATPase n=1 Tax=Janibacter terrae TaxID=103817 RepID=UPI0009ED4FF5|nr:AAA family ATPase [Janibacter terrae]
MTRILVTSPSPDLQARFGAATGGAFLSLTPPSLPSDPAQLFALLDGAPAPEVVVLDAASDLQRALDLATQLDEQCPQVAVILVAENGTDLGLAAMRSGVRDIVHPQAEIAEIQSVLDRAALAAQALAHNVPAVPDTAPATGRVISVLSPKGGVGKTTVATNLAVGLARSAPGSTVLVDLDVQFGDVASALDLAPEFTLADVVRGPATRDSMVLKTFLTLHETGLYAICAPASPAVADTISSEDVSHLLAMLALEFRYVVVDTAPGLSEHTLAALDRTTDHVLLTSMDVPGVRGLRKELDTLGQLGMLPPSKHVVVNFADKRGGLSIADVEATIGTKVDVRLPVSPATRVATNKGVPLLQSGGRDPVTKQLRRLVERLVVDQVAVAPPGPQDRPARHGRRRGR